MRWRTTVDGLDLYQGDREGVRCLQVPFKLKMRLWERMGYRPFPWQLEFHRSTARTKMSIAGARLGKSLGGTMDGMPEICTPGTKTWIVGSTYELASREFAYVVEGLQRLGHGSDIDVQQEVIERHSQPSVGKCTLRTKWGSIVETKSADNPDQLLGEELDLIILSEGSRIKRDIVERYLVARLATRQGRMIIPTTPHGANWLVDWYRRGQTYPAEWRHPRHPRWASSYQSWNFPTWHNPFVPMAEVRAAFESLDRDVFAEQWGGLFVRMSGLVYNLRQYHIIDEMPANWQTWGCYRGIDFGYTNPFVCLWVAFDPDGRMYIFDEYYQTRRLIEQHARVINNRHKGLLVHATYADWDAQDRAELAAKGIPTTAANKAIREGIMTCKNALVRQGDGKPRLFIHRKCVETINEMGNYAWPPERSGEDKNEEEEPLDFMNHAMDAMRYVAHSVGPTVGHIGAADAMANLPAEDLWSDLTIGDYQPGDLLG